MYRFQLFFVSLRLKWYYMKKTVWPLMAVLLVFVIATIGVSFYMLEFSLAPDKNRADTDSCYRQLFSNYPMLFIHGDSDKFVPTNMVYQLYEAKPAPKELWIASETAHARSYMNHRAEYIQRVGTFITHPF